MGNIRTKVGQLNIREYTSKQTGELYYAGTGDFATLTMQMAIGIKPAVRSESAPAPTDKSVTHEVFHIIGGKAASRVGVAWASEISKGDNKGKPRFRISLTHPSLPKWARKLVAWPVDGEEGVYSIDYEEEGERGPAAPAGPDEGLEEGS